MLKSLKKYYLIKKYKLHRIFSLIDSNGVIFDIGAHNGDKSSNLEHFSSKIILVEPQPDCLKILNKRFGQNSKILILPYGISASASKLDLQINSSNPLISTFSNHWKTGRFSNSNWDKKITVETKTLDQLIKSYGKPSYIKIDVEGFEFEVLKGLSEKVGYISFEFTSEFFKNATNCLNRLENIGYNEFTFSEGEKKKFNIDWTSKQKILKIINNEIIKYPNLWGDIYAR